MDISVNRYQPPQSEVTDAEAEHLAIEPASRLRRFATFVIDYICFVVLAAIVGFFAVLVAGEDALTWLDVPFGDMLFGVALMVAYYIPMESVWGRTIGKFVMGTKVVNEEGGPARLGQIVGRTFARFIPFEVFSCLSSDARGWHDSLPKTYVVMCR
jgi:uncharacterized RDD family membrane protein YckC